MSLKTFGELDGVTHSQLCVQGRLYWECGISEGLKEDRMMKIWENTIPDKENCMCQSLKWEHA